MKKSEDLKKKSDYLMNPVVSGFVKFLKEVVSGNTEIQSSYTPAKDKKNKFSANTVEEALINYKWGGKTYIENKEILDSLSQQLISGNKSKNELETLVTCLKVLEWGEVYRGAVGWLADAADKEKLVEKISKSVEILEGDDLNKTALFNQNQILRCDSGTTKIFSLASKKSIIYDGRVACAMGMLIIDYLSKETNFKTIPVELDLLMDSPSSSTNRNPSVKKYKFVSKSNQKSKGINHAVSNIKSNWIIEKVVNSQSFQWECYGLNGDSNLIDKMRAVEAAFFMIGYKSEKTEYPIKGYYLIEN